MLLVLQGSQLCITLLNGNNGTLSFYLLTSASSSNLTDINANFPYYRHLPQTLREIRNSIYVCVCVCVCVCVRERDTEGGGGVSSVAALVPPQKLRNL
jgi:hypothetical protein